MAPTPFLLAGAGRRPFHASTGWAPTRSHTAVAAALLCLTAASAYAQTPAASTTVAQGPSSLQEVVISGARSERALADVPASVDVLTQEDLDPAQVQDIRDLTRDLPNLSVKRAPVRFGGVTGSVGRDGNAGFNIRGLEGNRVLLTVDGIRVPRELNSGVFGPAAFGRDYFDLGLISRVEILRGASSALYGSDGLAGMVAMFTTEPKDLLKDGQTLGGRVGLSLDTEDGSRRLGLTVAGIASDTVQWLGSVQLGRNHELDNQGSNTTLNSSRTAPNPQQDRHAGLLGKVVITPGGGQRHTLTFEHVDKSSEVEAYSGRAAAATSATSVVDLDGDSDMQRTRLSWDGRFRVGGGWADELRATLGWQNADSREVTFEKRLSAADRSRDVSYTERTLQATLQAEKTAALGTDWSHKLVYGTDLTQARLDNLVTGVTPPAYESYPLQRFPTTDERTVALFAQSEFATERWSVIPALRYDHVTLDAQKSALYPLEPASLSASALTPKLGMIYRATDTLQLFGNLAAGFKAPSPLQLNNYFENVTGYYKTIPNPDLKPEKSRTLELGSRFSSGGVDWEAAAFTGRYRDFIEELVAVGGTATPGDPLTYQAVNRGAVRLSGFELKGKLRVGAATTLRAAYGVTRGTDTRQNVPLNSVNPPKLVLGVDHRVGHWTLGATVTHVAAKSLDDIQATGTQAPFAPPAYTTLDLRAVWQIQPRLKLSASLRNLTNQTYWEWTNVRGLAANSPLLDSYTAPGRSLAVALVSEF